MPYFKNDTVNLLLIHIPKTGGTSQEQYFSKKYNIPLNDRSLYMFLDEEQKRKHNIHINSSLQHLTYNTLVQYKEFFGINFDNISIIACVRNPYERIMSDLFFFDKITIHNSAAEVFAVIKDYINSTNLDNHNIPQYLFITDDKRALIPTIKILRTETLTDDMIKLGYTDFNVHVLRNKTPAQYYPYLNRDSINLINEFYDYDFTLFNYKKL
jgi:hypothetical protein